MKMTEITELSTDELLTKRRDLRQERLHLRLQQQSGQLEQPSRLRLLRRDIARLEAVLTQRENPRRSARKARTGEVISSSMNKTIIVRTVTRVPHPKFGKIVKQMKKFYAHDEKNEAKVGDTVRIMETRPLSKLKRWRLAEVIQK